MKLHPEEWQKEIADTKDDPYTSAIVRVAEKVMDLMEAKGDEPFDAHELMLQANKELDEGITGNMSGFIAYLVSKYHSRGDEFKSSWNKRYGGDDSKGVVNPAIINI